MRKKTARRPLCHSVGAIVKNSKGHYLVLYRKVKPKGLAFPAGHIEPDETPEEALIRELYEETGLKAKRIQRKLRATIRGCCKLGANKHLWHVFRIIAYSGRPKRREKTKHQWLKFMSPKKIREEYVNRKDVDPSWVKIFRRLKIINGRH